MKWHFVMECEAYEDIRIQYENILKVDNMHYLFEEDKRNQVARLQIKIHGIRSGSDIEKGMKMSQGGYYLDPLGWLTSWMSLKMINQSIII